MTTPAITAPAVATVATPGTTATTATATPTTAVGTEAAPADAFASLLSAMTGTTGTAPTTTAPGPAPVPSPGLVKDTTPVLDPTALAAAALTAPTAPPVLLPDAVPTLAVAPPAVEPTAAPAPAATAFAPGQVKAAGTPAKELAPGQVKPAHEPAKELSPGHRAKTADTLPTTADPAATSAPVITTTPATAPAPAPVPVTAPVATEPTHTVRPAIAAAAKRLTHQGDRTSLVVRLDPPELGAVLVRMTVREGQVEVTLRAPDLAAQGGLLAQAPEIQQVLKEAGLDLTSFDVSYGELAQGQQQDRRGTPDRGTPQQRGGADGTVHVTDDVTDPQPAGTWL